MHSIQRILSFVTFFLLANCLFGQSIKILKLSSKKDFKEINTFSWDSALRISSEVWYDEKGTIDEEYCYRFELAISNTAGLFHKRIKLTDSSAVKYLFDLFSVWNWGGENVAVEGDFTILSITDKTIKVDLNFKVRDRKRERIYVYNGGRTFIKLK